MGDFIADGTRPEKPGGARQIQSSIPATVPELENLRIAVRYLPMTAVAGDFYQFVRADDNHLGILVADVSGHGIPAALISSMVKVAMQSVVVHVLSELQMWRPAAVSQQDDITLIVVDVL